MAIMRDPAQTTFVFVLHPEAIAIKETQRAVTELGKLEIHTHQLIVNSLSPPEATDNPLFAARAAMQARYLQQIEAELPLPTRRMMLLSGEIKGVARLREVGRMFFDGVNESAHQPGCEPAPVHIQSQVVAADVRLFIGVDRQCCRLRGE